MTKPQRSLIDHFHRPKDISAYKEKKKTLRQNQKISKLGQYLQLITDERLISKNFTNPYDKQLLPIQKWTEGSFQMVNTHRKDASSL